MAFQEVTSTSWFGRIGSAIKGVFFGLLLGIISVVLLVWNERNAVRDMRANEELGSMVTSVATENIDPAMEGKLVQLSGRADTSEILRNEPFAIGEKGIQLSWQSMIYQWRESSKSETKKKLGGGEETVTTYSYEKVWSEKPIDSSAFKEAGHENKGERQYRSGSVTASEVKFGAFLLPPGLVAKIDQSEPLPLRTLPPAMEGKGTIVDGVFFTGNPDQPAIGDEKVSFRVTRPCDVSVMAVQSGNSFKPFVASNGKEKFLLYDGLLTADEMVAGEERKAMILRWVLRLGGVLLMWFGLLLLVQPIRVVADFIPFLGTLVGFLTGGLSLLLSAAISMGVIALSWLAFRPLLSLGMLAAGVVCVSLVLMLRKKPATA